MIPQIVVTSFLDWVGQFEGVWLDAARTVRFRWLGLDKEGRPSSAYGSDFASAQAMAEVVWRTGPGPSDPPATFQQIADEWHRVNSMQAHKGEGGASAAFRDSARLFYDVPSLYNWCGRKLGIMYDARRKAIPGWDSVPLVGRLARLRTSWADGAFAEWPHLDAAISRGDWVTAAAECMPRDYSVQTLAYQRSYDAVRTLYQLAPSYPGDELPSPMPDGKPQAVA